MASGTLYGVMPYDPETGKCFVNAIGSSKKESQSNMLQIDVRDEVFERLEYLEGVTISWSYGEST